MFGELSCPFRDACESEIAETTKARSLERPRLVLPEIAYALIALAVAMAMTGSYILISGRMSRASA